MFILAIDQGTTGNTALIIDSLGKIISEGSHDHPQHYPKPGFVEHNASEIKNSVETAIKIALQKAKVNGKEIAGIGITNQRETTCLFNQEGESYLPFIVWQCRRSNDICQELRNRGLADFFHKKTGLHIDPYFSASKISWAFKEHPSLLAKARSGELLFGTIDTFICHWLSGHKLHITDATNASRTMLMDINKCEWSDECLDIFQIPKNILPKIQKSTGPYGTTSGLGFLPDGIPIAAIAGDQQAALFGQACFLEGDAKATYGTGSFILLNTGKRPIFSKHGLLTSIAYHIDSEPIYCLEGSAFIAGAAVEFLHDAFGLVRTAREIEALARSVPDSHGVIFVPALCGLGAPYWRAEARGIISGLDRGVTRGHIARATLEGVALQNTDIIAAMAKDGVALKSLKVDGGAAENDLLMATQADLLGVPCFRTGSAQKTALGAGYLAGLALGIFPNLEFLSKITHKTKEFLPNPDRSWANMMIARYHETLSKA
jgi:glycerol kinase